MQRAPSASDYETKPLAFVDVETTGLSPSRNDIAEIGVVTVDGPRVERWSTLIKARSRRELALAKGVVPDDLDNAPTFADIAVSLAQRLSGRLVVAHNARFAYTFLRTAFQRVDISFEPELICSVMLSRKLYLSETHHNLDSLIERHTLCADVRHRALPDADVLWQWWQAIHREFPRDVIGKAIKQLLAGLVLPPHLDPALIDRLPEAPGAYVFHGEGNIPLLTGAAANLKCHVRNYFRIDQATDKALEHSHRITNITWRVTCGFLGARLHAAEFHGTLPAKATRSRNANLVTWQFLPDALPVVSVVAFPGSLGSSASAFFGLFTSECKRPT